MAGHDRCRACWGVIHISQNNMDGIDFPFCLAASQVKSHRVQAGPVAPARGLIGKLARSPYQPPQAVHGHKGHRSDLRNLDLAVGDKFVKLGAADSSEPACFGNADRQGFKLGARFSSRLARRQLWITHSGLPSRVPTMRPLQSTSSCRPSPISQQAGMGVDRLHGDEAGLALSSDDYPWAR